MKGTPMCPMCKLNQSFPLLTTIHLELSIHRPYHISFPKWVFVPRGGAWPHWVHGHLTDVINGVVQSANMYLVLEGQHEGIQCAQCFEV
jgi:hypothetical protein